MPPALATGRRSALLLALGIALGWGPVALAQDPAPAKPPAGTAPKETGGFAEPRKGDVPEGAADLVTPATDQSISSGLAWLSKQQNSDGSYGSGAYRGNIAVTSLAGLAFMANGSSPGRGPYGPQIDKALQYVMDNTTNAGFIAVPNAGTHGPMYSHGFGTLFLAEAYGMSRIAPRSAKNSTKAVRLIIDCQNPRRGVALSARPPRRRPLGHDLPDQRPPGREERRDLRPQGDGRRTASDYVKQSQNTDGGFRYMLQGGASAFPRSAAGVVALYSAAIYDAKEIESGVELPQAVHARDQARPAVTAITSTAITTPPRRCGFEAATTGPRGIRRSATSWSGASRGLRRLLARHHLQRVRHGDGPDHPPDAEQLFAHLPALNRPER